MLCFKGVVRWWEAHRSQPHLVLRITTHTIVALRLSYAQKSYRVIAQQSLPLSSDIFDGTSFYYTHPLAVFIKKFLTNAQQPCGVIISAHPNLLTPSLLTQWALLLTQVNCFLYKATPTPLFLSIRALPAHTVTHLPCLLQKKSQKTSLMRPFFSALVSLLFLGASATYRNRLMQNLQSSVTKKVRHHLHHKQHRSLLPPSPHTHTLIHMLTHTLPALGQDICIKTVSSSSHGVRYTHHTSAEKIISV